MRTGCIITNSFAVGFNCAVLLAVPSVPTAVWIAINSIILWWLVLDQPWARDENMPKKLGTST